MLKVAEQQARNWKVDRVLYFACRGDKENFCANVKAGASGQVYDCLFKHKNDPSMSQEVSILFDQLFLYHFNFSALC